MAVIMSATAAARPPTVDLRPLAAMAATSERPARVGVSTSQCVAAGWLRERVAELEASGPPGTLRRREQVVVCLYCAADDADQVGTRPSVN